MIYSGPTNNSSNNETSLKSMLIADSREFVMARKLCGHQLLDPLCMLGRLPLDDKLIPCTRWARRGSLPNLITHALPRLLNVSIKWQLRKNAWLYAAIPEISYSYINSSSVRDGARFQIG